MGFALGFGSTEQAVEDAEEAAFVDYVTEEYHRQGLNYFSDEFVKQIEDWARQRGEEAQREAEKFRKAETFPDRYSSFYASVAQSALLISAS